MKTILLICTGNTCRSSMAEVLLKRITKSTNHDKKQDFNIVSAGISAIEGDRANPQAIKVMEEWGIDLKEHRARQLTEEMVAQADLILTMTQKHRDFLKLMYPGAGEKTYTLTEYVNGSKEEIGDLDIEDPFGGSVETYRRTGAQIKEILQRLVEKLGDVGESGD